MQPWISPIFERLRKRFYFTPGCHCCGTPETGSYCTVDCPDDTFKCWEIVIAGVTDGTCSDCNENYNGTWTLVWQSNCAWTAVINSSSVCGSTAPAAIQMNRGGLTPGTCSGTQPGSVVVNGPAFGGAMATWELTDIGNFNCEGDNEYTLCSSRGECATWPTTITATPAVCP